MKTRPQRYTDLHESFHERSRYLRALYRYIASGHNAPGSGRGQDHRVCLIYWPDIFESFTKVTHLSQRTGCPKPPEATSAFRMLLRRYIEELLGPLLLPVEDQPFALYANLQGIDPASEPYKPLVELDNYTAFIRLNIDTTAALRTLVGPPMLGPLRPWMNELPEELRLLLEAWTLLTQRAQSGLFSTEESGLTYLRDGMLFIHWQTFLQSGLHRLPRKDIKHTDVCQQLEQSRTPFSLKGGMIRRDEKPLDNASFEDLLYSDRFMNKYQKALRSSGLCETHDSLCDYCTVIDPIYLFRKDGLFDGRKHMLRRQRIKRSFVTAGKRYERAEVAERTVRVYPFTFRPLDYLGTPQIVQENTDAHRWFDKDHTETLYAVRRKNQFFFTRPRFLDPNNPELLWEMEAWQRGLDALNLIEQLIDGEVVDVTARTKSQLFKRETRALRERAGAAFIKNFVSIEDTPKRQMDAAVKSYVTKFQREDPALANSSTMSGNWYNKLVSKIAQDYLKPTSVRFKAVVKLPDEKEPKRLVFFSPQAIEAFRRFGLGSFQVLADDAKEQALAVLFAQGMQPAPYVLAWARFCLDVNLRHPEGVRTFGDQRDGWTPADDYYLLCHYHSRPRMTKDEWTDLLSRLANRTKETCIAHVSGFNKMLKRVTSPTRYDTHHVGHKACDPIAAKRAILLVGCARTLIRRNEKVNQHSAFIKRIFDMTDEAVEGWAVPQAYRAQFFDSFIQ